MCCPQPKQEVNVKALNLFHFLCSHPADSHTILGSEFTELNKPRYKNMEHEALRQAADPRRSVSLQHFLLWLAGEQHSRRGPQTAATTYFVHCIQDVFIQDLQYLSNLKK